MALLTVSTESALTEPSSLCLRQAYFTGQRRIWASVRAQFKDSAEIWRLHVSGESRSQAQNSVVSRAMKFGPGNSVLMSKLAENFAKLSAEAALQNPGPGQKKSNTIYLWLCSMIIHGWLQKGAFTCLWFNHDLAASFFPFSYSAERVSLSTSSLPNCYLLLRNSHESLNTKSCITTEVHVH